jgi:L-rhamnose mutarotase
MNMIRTAFIMQVDPGKQDEYRKRHHPIWPELESVLKSHGVHSYSIFLDPRSGQLFAYAEIQDLSLWESIAQTDVCKRWWRHMSEIMPSNPDFSPVTHELQEVFHIDQNPPDAAAKP